MECILGRRGEEHSFILKPATSTWKTLKVPGERNTQPSHSRTGSVSSGFHHPINVDQTTANNDQYAVLVSCRCNYTGNVLFIHSSCFYQITSKKFPNAYCFPHFVTFLCF